MKRLMLLGLVVFAVAACADRDVAGVHDEVAMLEAGPAYHIAHGAGDLKVMSQNMYFGAPVEPIMMEPDPDAIPFRVAEAWAAFLATDFPSRARAMAEEMAKQKPHLIGLQEVSIIRTQYPSDIAVPPGTTPNFVPNAEDTVVNFVEVLIDELAARGAQYVLAARVENTDVEVPRIDSIVMIPDPPYGIPFFTDVRLTDYDVILVRADVETANPNGANYAAEIPIPPFITVKRGWTSVDAQVRGRWYRFFSTHLDAEVPEVRYLQAAELVGNVIGAETMPVVVVGDINSGPGRRAPGDPDYDVEMAAYFAFMMAGYTDVATLDQNKWRNLNTCCHDGDLTEPSPAFDQRIDLVLAKNMDLSRPPWPQTSLVNDSPWLLRRYGVWASDHAGVISSLVFPQRK